MDDLDRLAFRVARTVRTTYPHLLEHGFTLADLEETLAPYAQTRRELAIDGPSGYETTLLRLLSGERGYLATAPEVQEACRQALQSTSPSVSLVRAVASSALTLCSGAFALAESGARAAVANTAAAPAAGVPAAGVLAAGVLAAGVPAAGAPAAGAPVAGAPVASSAVAPAANRGSCDCPYCGGELPVGRSTRFCPRCGLDLTVRHCPACSTELERQWRFCVTCGREADVDTPLVTSAAA
jgi:hypothetical protein